MPIPEEFTKIPPDTFLVDRSRKLLNAIRRNPFTNLLGCYKKESLEMMVIDVEVELPQHPPVPIHQTEQIAIIVQNETNIPRVLALREDFPQTIHQNAVPVGELAWLCLYEDRWEEISDFVTPELFVERIRLWLKRAAVEELHLVDQPLEPFLLTPYRFIIDEAILKSGLQTGQILISGFSGNMPELVSLAFQDIENYAKRQNDQNKNENKYFGLWLLGTPTATSIIPRLPVDIVQLSDLLITVDIDLFSDITNLIKTLMHHFPKKVDFYGAYKLLVILSLPKLRIEGQPPETSEYWAFLINSTIKELGSALNLLGQVSNMGTGFVLGGIDKGKNLPSKETLKKFLVLPFSPTYSFTPNLAGRLSGNDGKDLSKRIGVIGLGALGSTVVMNLARQGIGEWILIDPDVLLPHNLARHALSKIFVGQSKAIGIQTAIGFDFGDEKLAKQFSISYLDVKPEGKEEEVNCNKELSSSDLILDFSASNSVFRKLAVDKFDAPRLSAALVPSGKYCLAYYEGKGRAIRIDDLEQQLMVHILLNKELHDIFHTDDKQFQYAGSCRDLSRIMENDWFLGYAGVLSKFIKQSILSKEPRISVFNWKENPQQLREISIPVLKTKLVNSGGWEIRITSKALSLLHRYRIDRLPNETGGILIGNINYVQKIIYISHVLPSPPDSKEWPMAYIRGVRGLSHQVENILNVTHDSLIYIGEWHSHPDGFGVNPSAADKTALSWVSGYMESIGFPGILAIIGEDERLNFLIE